MHSDRDHRDAPRSRARASPTTTRSPRSSQYSAAGRSGTSCCVACRGRRCTPAASATTQHGDQHDEHACRLVARRSRARGRRATRLARRSRATDRRRRPNREPAPAAARTACSRAALARAPARSAVAGSGLRRSARRARRSRRRVISLPSTAIVSNSGGDALRPVTARRSSMNACLVFQPSASAHAARLLLEHRRASKPSRASTLDELEQRLRRRRPARRRGPRARRAPACSRDRRRRSTRSRGMSSSSFLMRSRTSGSTLTR